MLTRHVVLLFARILNLRAALAHPDQAQLGLALVLQFVRAIFAQFILRTHSMRLYSAPFGLFCLRIISR